MTLTNRFTRLAILVAAFLPLPGMVLPAAAATSEWIGTRGGKLRLVALPPEMDGSLRGFIEIAPDDGWHTYWKVPGSGGIPPQVTLKEGGNVRLERLDFPAPRIFEDGDLRDFGYDTRVMLPLSLKQDRPGQPSTISASIFIGLCADICVPFQANATVRVAPGDKPKPAEVALVNAAHALLPEAPGPDFAIETAQTTPDGKGVALTLRIPAGADAATTDVIVIGPDRQPLGKLTRLTSPEGRLVGEVKPALADAEPMRGRVLDIVAISGSRAMETTVTVK